MSFLGGDQAEWMRRRVGLVQVPSGEGRGERGEGKELGGRRDEG